jgi:hypothetical protein
MTQYDDARSPKPETGKQSHATRELNGRRSTLNGRCSDDHWLTLDARMLNGQCSDGQYPTVNTRMLNGRTTVDVTMTMDDGQRTTMDSRQPMDDNRPTTTTVGDRPTTTDQGQCSDAQRSTLG